MATARIGAFKLRARGQLNLEVTNLNSKPASPNDASEIERVLNWSGWTYTAKGHQVQAVQFAKCITALYVEDMRRTELVVTNEHFGCLDHERLRDMRTAGEVWVLTPLASLGRAHAALRGLADRLVPWWMGNDEIKFGMPEIP